MTTTRLTTVELRKATDTRAGFWLQLATAAIMLAAVTLLVIVGDHADRALDQVLALAVQPAGVLLPIVGILLVTSEWSQSTTLTTFALVPQRSRVVSAKLLASLALALAAFVICLALSLIATAAVAGGVEGAWHLPATMVLQMFVYLAIAMVGGVAFGAALLSSAPAIVLSFVLPLGWSAIASIRFFNDAGEWLDTTRTSEPLTEHALSATEWAQLGTSQALWLLLPLTIGLIRIARGEIRAA
jgi:ABC-2 type transport system permease protein